jgi:AraC family transcriptional regulator of arabinose operon
MKRPAETMYDPAAVRRADRVPSYIWTGHEVGATGRVVRPNGIKPNWHLILVLSGRASFRQPGMERPLAAGDLILFPPDCHQDYGAVDAGGWENLFAHFSPRPQWHAWMRWPEIGDGLHLVHLKEGETRDRVREALERSHRYAHSSFSTFAHELALSALEEAILLGAHEATYTTGAVRRSPSIARAVEAIVGALAERHSVRSLARLAKLSPSRFSHLFKEEVGEPVIAYINRLRIREAARLLEAEGMSVKEVAEAVGYSSPFYFSRQFRRFYFIDPSGFRKHAARMRTGEAPKA